MQKRTKMLSVRASEEEVRIVKQFAAEIRKTNRYAKEADVLRELIGLEDTGLITPTMRKRLLALLRENTPSIPTKIPAEFEGSHKSTMYVPSLKKGGKK